MNKAECLSQPNNRRITFACQYCAGKKRPCEPLASWAEPIRELMTSRGKLPVGGPLLRDSIDMTLDAGIEVGPSSIGTSSNSACAHIAFPYRLTNEVRSRPVLSC